MRLLLVHAVSVLLDDGQQTGDHLCLRPMRLGLSGVAGLKGVGVVLREIWM